MSDFKDSSLVADLLKDSLGLDGENSNFRTFPDSRSQASNSSDDIARNVRYMRELRGWSQSELARLTGLSRTTIRRIEAGYPCWKPTLQQLAKAFGNSVPEIVFTTRFKNVLEEGTTHVMHKKSRELWFAMGDRRSSVSDANAHQDRSERQRLGKLGFVPIFLMGLDYYLSEGPGITRLEVYGRYSDVFKPQFRVTTIYVLVGKVKLRLPDRVEVLEPGDSIAYWSELRVEVEPATSYSGGDPAEILVIGTNRIKVPMSQGSNLDKSKSLI